MNKQETLTLYQEHAIFLPEYGWPLWPPSESPKPREKNWWNTPKDLLPIHSEHRPWPARIIEIDGLPQAGKSTLEEIVAEKLKPELEKAGWSFEVWKEQLFSTSKAVFEIRPPLPPPVGDDRLPLEINFASWEKDWITSLWLQAEKYRWWAGMIENLISSAEPNHQKFILGYRGPVDALVWSYALATHQEDPNFTIPEWYREDLEREWLPIFINALLTAKKIDAVVLIGVSQETAKSRRVNKNYPGWVTDSSIFVHLSNWYGYFIEQVHPKLHKLWGTGLLVLDGEAKLEKNVEKICNYCRRIAGVNLTASRVNR